MSGWPDAEGVLLRVERPAPTAHLLRLRAVSGGRPFRWEAGQHLRLLPPGGEAPLYLSIASAPDPARPGELDLLVEVAPGTPRAAWLGGLSAGDRVALQGPAGSLRPPDPEAPLLLVAAGTGITPLRALLQERLASSDPAPVLLLFGARTPERLWFDAELRALDGERAGFAYWPTVSGAAPGWTGRRGRVQAHLPEALQRLPGASAVVCGGAEMVRQVRALLQRLGLSPHRVASAG